MAASTWRKAIVAAVAIGSLSTGAVAAWANTRSDAAPERPRVARSEDHQRAAEDRGREAEQRGHEAEERGREAAERELEAEAEAEHELEANRGPGSMNSGPSAQSASDDRGMDDHGHDGPGHDRGDDHGRDL